MSICIVANPNAGSAEQIAHLEDIVRSRPDVTLWETVDAGHAEELARLAAAQDFDIIVAAGGDGTIKEVVNGIMSGVHRARLGLLPLGTGNDLARTLAIPTEPQAAFALLEKGRQIPLDLIEVVSGDRVVYGANAAAGGFSGQVNEAMTSELKATWGPLAYLLGAVSVMPDLTKYRTSLQYDDDLPVVESVFNVIVANGRTAAGGRRVAPSANPQDGLLDVVVVRTGTVIEMAEVAARLFAGDYTDSASVSHRRVRRIMIDSQPGMWFNVDGELFTNDPITFSVLPGAIDVLVGDEYMPEADNAVSAQ